ATLSRRKSSASGCYEIGWWAPPSPPAVSPSTVPDEAPAGRRALGSFADAQLPRTQPRQRAGHLWLPRGLLLRGHREYRHSGSGGNDAGHRCYLRGDNGQALDLLGDRRVLGGG